MGVEGLVRRSVQASAVALGAALALLPPNRQLGIRRRVMVNIDQIVNRHRAETEDIPLQGSISATDSTMCVGRYG